MLFDKINYMTDEEFQDYIYSLTEQELDDIMNYISYEMIECSNKDYRSYQIKLDMIDDLIEYREVHNVG